MNAHLVFQVLEGVVAIALGFAAKLTFACRVI
ncbi:hypothetical protein Cassandra_0298 [Pseudomonas phage Cassandra]|nr:hypothetical protein Cassandra_0298 [Pseudomonas phage Cassandra]WPK40007.1 hypothetical protein ETTORE_0298 [Pseudomonas phage Ettore]